jgi:hypothetical protein
MLALGIVVAASALLVGMNYYVVPIADRPFSPLHAQFAPTGLIGQGFGIGGTLMITVGVASYGARKRLRWLARFGKLKSWLEFHIFLCLLGPFLILLHTTFKFGGLVAIAFWSMSLVVASGVFGRWVYVWIPKTANGRFLGRDEIRQRLHGVLTELQSQLRMTPEQVLELLGSRGQPDDGAADRAIDPGLRPTSYRGKDRRRRPRRRQGILGAVTGSLRHALGARRERARFRRLLSDAGVPEPMRERLVGELAEERRLEEQLRMLEPLQTAFRYWHAFHLPLAIVMAVVLLIHVGVAIAFGYTWIWAT